MRRYEEACGVRGRYRMEERELLVLGQHGAGRYGELSMGKWCMLRCEHVWGLL